jgi:hypothetical protein
MVVKVVFTPPSEIPITLTNMTGITMIEERSKITSANITFANTPTMQKTIKDLGDHCAVQIFRDNEVIFDGDFINDNTNNNRITLQCWDKLYWISKAIRSFTQTTDDITASDAFEQAFDSAATFSYWTKVFVADTYATPFADAYSFDATSHVVPVDVADEYSNFFQGQAVRGTEFMRSLANAAKRGTVYDYYYWYEYKDGTRYLHFEPSGWGQTINAPSSSSTISVQRNRDNVFNNIHVWGQKIAGYIPNNGDSWTEESADGWKMAGTTVAMADNNVQKGQLSLEATLPGTNPAFTIYRHLTSKSDTINFETLDTAHVKVYVPNPCGAAAVEMRWALHNAGGAVRDTGYQALTIGAWNTLNYNKSDFSGGAADWTLIDYFSFHARENVGGTPSLTGVWIFDNLYYILEPMKSANSAVTSGYDSTSETSFGLKETSVNVNWLRTVADCNSIAESLVGYYADVHPVIVFSVPFFLNEGLNDNIKGTFYGTEYTLPIHRKTSVMNADGVWITTIQLGTGPLSFSDIISKQGISIKQNQYDAGLSYNTE